MATTFVDYTGDGNNNKAFSFPSYQESDVKVEIDNVLKTTSTHYNITNYSTTGGGTVVFTSGNIPASGTAIRIYRNTDVATAGGEYDPKATFAAGSSVKAGDLNNNQKQALYGIEENKDQTITTDRIKDGAVTGAKIFADAVDGTKIADDSINSEHYVAASIDNEHLADDAVGADELAANAVVNASVAAGAAIEFTKLENLDSGRILVGNGSNKATETVMSGDVTIDNAGATTITADAVQIGNISDTETSLTANSDAKIPTSKAVADHVVDVVNSVGGFVIVADKDNFPASHPDPNNDAGTVLSITNPNGLTVSSNTSSNGTRTGGSSTVTINQIPTSAGSTLTANYTMLVQTTSTEHTYDFYKFLAKDGDVLSLSNDINDFAARYRVNAGEPSSDNDEGDLVYDTNANKMKVYDGSSWGEVTSTGDFKFLALTVAGTANAAVYGSATSFDLKEGAITGAAASITSAAQLLVSVNGVIQKPNSGTSQPAEGFAMSDSDTIIFGSAPPSGSTVFAIQIGAATDLQVPADNTVTAAKLDLSIVQGDLIYGTGTDTWAKLAKGTAGKVLKMNSGATAPEWADDLNTQIGGANGVTFNDNVKIKLGTDTDYELYCDATNLVIDQTADGQTSLIRAKQNGTIQIDASDTGNQVAAKFKFSDAATPVSSAEFYYAGVKAFETSALGISATGGHFDGDTQFQGDDGLCWWDKSDNRLIFNDSTKATFGNGNDAEIYFDSANLYIKETTGSGDIYIESDDVYIRKNGGSETMAAFKSDGACELYYDSVKEFETKSGGVTLLGCSNSILNHWTNVTGSTTLDFSLADNHIVSLTGNATLANPSTEVAGQSGSIFVEQDGTGSRTLAYGTQFKWAGGTAPTLSTAANAVDRIDYIVRATDIIHCVISLDVK